MPRPQHIEASKGAQFARQISTSELVLYHPLLGPSARSWEQKIWQDLQSP